MPLIDSERVEFLFRDCLAAEQSEDPAKCKVVEGIMAMAAFSPDKLEEHRAEIEEMLRGLPIGFRPVGAVDEVLPLYGGGGWSFLLACDDRNGEQWTGLHMRMDQLFSLGQGLGVVKCLAPRSVWDTLPGGMPYYLVDLQ